MERSLTIEKSGIGERNGFKQCFFEFIWAVQILCRLSALATSSENRVVLAIYTTELKWFSVLIRLFTYFCTTRHASCH